jgi:activator of HSP90 ATPase
MWRQYDESLQTYFETQKDASNAYHLDDIDFGKRMAVERELDKAWASIAAATAATSSTSTTSTPTTTTTTTPATTTTPSTPATAVTATASSAQRVTPTVEFDESSNFILFPTMLGIKSMSSSMSRDC